VTDHQDISQLHPEANDDLDSVAARIRPLPREVAPSPEFLSRTRLRLLQLPHEAEPDATRRAA
jgi:hypothetical protein